MKTKKEGFTLIELLFVILIITFLLALVMPSSSRARESAKRSVCADQLRQIGMAIHAYAGDYDYSMPWWGYDEATPEDPYKGDEEGHPYVAYRGGYWWRFDPSVATDPWNPTLGKLKAMRVACLYEGGYITLPEMFYCPSNKYPLYKFESYNDPKPWGRLPQNYNKINGNNQWVRMGYEYYPTDPRTPTKLMVYNNVNYRVPRETAKKITGLDPNIPYMTDIIRRRIYMSHKTQNYYALHALYSDNHVVFCKDDNVFGGRIWDDWETASVDYRLFYYIIFKRIGESCP